MKTHPSHAVMLGLSAALLVIVCLMSACERIEPPADTTIDTTPDTQTPYETSAASTPDPAPVESTPDSSADLVPPAESLPVTVPPDGDDATDTEEIDKDYTFTPIDRELTDVDFSSGSQDENGILYGLLIDTYPPGEGITLQVLHSVEDFNKFSRYTAADYAAASANPFVTGMAALDGSFFASHDLVVIRTAGGSGSLRYHAVVEQADGKTTVFLTSNGSAGARNLAFWAILIPVDKGTDTADIVVKETTDPAYRPHIWPSVWRVDLEDVLPRDPEEGIEPH